MMFLRDPKNGEVMVATNSKNGEEIARICGVIVEMPASRVPLSTLELVTMGGRLIVDRHPISQSPTAFTMTGRAGFSVDYSRVQLQNQLLEVVERGNKEEIIAFVQGVLAALPVLPFHH